MAIMKQSGVIPDEIGIVLYRTLLYCIILYCSTLPAALPAVLHAVLHYPLPLLCSPPSVTVHFFNRAFLILPFYLSPIPHFSLHSSLLNPIPPLLATPPPPLPSPSHPLSLFPPPVQYSELLSTLTEEQGTL